MVTELAVVVQVRTAQAVKAVQVDLVLYTY
jgi:hypothetical protein